MNKEEKQYINELHKFKLSYGKYKGLTMPEIITQKDKRGYTYLKWILEKYKAQQKDMELMHKFLKQIEHKYEKNETYSFI